MHKCQGQNSSISMSLKHFWISREERTCPITLSYMAFCFCSLTALGTGQLISLGFVHSRFIMAPVALWALRKRLWCCSAWSCGELQCRLGRCRFLEEVEIVIRGPEPCLGFWSLLCEYLDEQLWDQSLSLARHRAEECMRGTGVEEAFSVYSEEQMAIPSSHLFSVSRA